jgi:hypothetical protein
VGNSEPGDTQHKCKNAGAIAVRNKELDQLDQQATGRRGQLPQPIDWWNASVRSVRPATVDRARAAATGWGGGKNERGEQG